MSNLLLKAIAEHKNEAVRAESKARVLQVLQGTRIDVVIELLEELLEHLRAIVKEEAPEEEAEEESEEEEPEEDNAEEEDEDDDGEEDSERARPGSPSEGSQGPRARPSGRETPSEARENKARENREPSKASQVRAALAGGPLPRDRVVMQLAALPPGADATAREHRRTIQAWRQMLSNLQRQGDLEVLAGDAIGLTTAGKERAVMEQRLSAFRESLLAPAPTPEPAPTRALEEPRRAEDQPETGEEDDERLARLRREEERAIEAAWVETEALVLGVFRKAKRAMNYRDVVEEMAGNVPQILIRSLQDVAPHTRLGAVVRKTLLRLQTAGKVTTDTLDSSRWKLQP